MYKYYVRARIVYIMNSLRAPLILPTVPLDNNIQLFRMYA